MKTKSAAITKLRIYVRCLAAFNQLFAWPVAVTYIGAHE
jgi:hypothetical protein